MVSAMSTSSARRLLTALLLALCLVAVGAGPAAAQPPRTFFGVQGWETTNPGDLAMLGEARVGVVREIFTWARVEPAPGVRDWSYYDALVTSASERGVTVLPVLFGSPAFAAARPHQMPGQRKARAAFARFAADAVKRYGRRGAFWKAHPDLPFRPPIGWEVWNEPNARISGTSAASYRKATLPAARAIRSVDGGEKIVLAGLAGKNLAPSYLAKIYEQKSFKRYFDVVSVHPYSPDVKGLKDFVARMRKVMSRAGDSRTPVWVTELGWATGGRKSFLRVTRSRQASLLRGAFRALADMRQSARVGLVIWFSLRDRADDRRQTRGGPSAYNKTGLFELSGRPKPAWEVFRRYTRATHPPPGGEIGPADL